MTLIPRKSLIRTALFQMSLRIALVVSIVTLLSYWHVISILESQTVAQLEKYIVERGQRENYLFTLAGTYHEVFKQEFITRYQAMGDDDPIEAFNQLFVKMADDTTRIRPEYFYGFKSVRGTTIKGITGFIDKKVIITAEIRKRLLIAYDLLNSYGVAWDKPFYDFYVSTPENILMARIPKVPWGLKMPASFDILKEEWHYVSDLAHNPQRQTTWTGVYYDVMAKQWMVSCITPIDIDSQHRLSLGNDILLNNLFNRIISDHLEGAYNFIFQSDGRLIAHPQRMADIQAKQGKWYIQHSDDQHLIRIFQQVKQLDSGKVVTINRDDNEYLAITKIQGPNWYFVTVYPKSLLAKLAWQVIRFIFILGVLSLLAEIIILFWVLRQRVAQPLHEFMNATHQIAQGHFTLQLDTTRNDELGQLAENFKSMALEIQAREEHLIQAKLAVEVTNQQLQQEIMVRQQVEIDLQSAKEIAEIANRAKSVFLANMSHELRTPLNGILGYAQILKDDLLTAEQQEGLEIIQQSGEHLLTLIDDLLDISRVEAGQLTLCPAEFNLPRLLEKLVEIFRLQAQTKGISLIFQYSSVLPGTIFYGDPRRFRQILVNLLSNAIKFTKQGQVVLQVSYQNRKLSFQVTDTGIGIAPAEVSKICLPFQQGGDPRFRPNGAGLGLAITEALIEMMGGQLQVESVLGQGSIFKAEIDLPCWF